MQLKMSRILVVAAVCGGLVLTACGGGGGGTPTATAPVGGYPVESGGGSLDGSSGVTPEPTFVTESYPVP